MSMPEAVWGQPRLLKARTLARAAKELGQSGVAQGLVSTLPAPPDEEEKRARHIAGTLRHHISVHRVQRDRFMEVDHAFHPAFGADPLGMVTAPAHRHAAAAIGNVLQM